MLQSESTVTGNTETTRPANRAVYPALDGLRAIAFLMVFCQHYLQLPWGWTGVNIFFVLSGFLISGILLDTRDEPYHARNFYVRRTLRIFPLYYGICIALLISWPIMHWQWTSSWIAWPLYVGNFLRFVSPAVTVQGSPWQLAADAQLLGHHLRFHKLYFGHFWSLCVEEQFYLLWPWVVFKLRSRRALLAICSAAVLLAPCCRAIAVHMVPTWLNQGELAYRFTPFQLDALLLGALLAFLWRGEHRALLLRLAAWCAPVLLAVLALYLQHTVKAGPLWQYPYPTWKFSWGQSFFNLLAASLILCCLNPANFFARLLHTAPLRWLGRISYGAYVFHDIFHAPLYAAVSGMKVRAIVAHSSAATAALALVITMVVSWASFRFFESPFLRLKEKWTMHTPLPKAA